jgi:hypothetical protein
MLSVTNKLLLQIAVILSVVMLSVIMLSVIMLTVMAPFLSPQPNSSKNLTAFSAKATTRIDKKVFIKIIPGWRNQSTFRNPPA